MVVALAAAQGAGLAARAGSSTWSARSRPAIVAVVVGVTKFTDGAWMIVIVISS